MSMSTPEWHVPEWTLGDRLRKAREATGQSQAQLAADLDVSPRSLGKYERGDAEPKRHVLLAWAMATGVPYAWLVDGSTGGTNPPGDQEQGPTGRSSVSPGQGNARVLQLVA